MPSYEVIFISDLSLATQINSPANPRRNVTTSSPTILNHHFFIHGWDGIYIFFLFFIWLKIEHAICIGITYNSFSTIPSDSCAVVRCCSTCFLRHFRGVFFAGHGFPGIMEGWLGEVWSPQRCLKDPIPITLRKSSPNRIFPVKNQGFYHKGLCDFTWPFPTMV